MLRARMMSYLAHCSSCTGRRAGGLSTGRLERLSAGFAAAFGSADPVMRPVGAAAAALVVWDFDESARLDAGLPELDTFWTSRRERSRRDWDWPWPVTGQTRREKVKRKKVKGRTTREAPVGDSSLPTFSFSLFTSSLLEKLLFIFGLFGFRLRLLGR
jgi:hypothetical protein